MSQISQLAVRYIKHFENSHPSFYQAVMDCVNEMPKIEASNNPVAIANQDNRIVNKMKALYSQLNKEEQSIGYLESWQDSGKRKLENITNAKAHLNTFFRKKSQVQQARKKIASTAIVTQDKDKALLLNLPDELLLRIFSMFCKEDAILAGATCRRLHTISKDASLNHLPLSNKNYAAFLPNKTTQQFFSISAFPLNKIIYSMIALPENHYAVGLEYGEINVINASTKQKVDTLPPLLFPTQPVGLIASEDDKLMVIACSSGDVRIWNRGTNKINVGNISVGIQALTDLNNKEFAIGCNNGAIKIFRLAMPLGPSIRTIQGPQGAITALTLLSGGLLASGSKDNIIKVWDKQTGKCINTLIGHKGQINTLLALENGLLASGSDDCTIKYWDVRTGKCIKTLNGHMKGVTTLVKLPVPNQIASNDPSNTILIWDTTENAPINKIIGEGSQIGILQDKHPMICLSDGRLVDAVDGTGVAFYSFKRQTFSPPTLTPTLNR